MVLGGTGAVVVAREPFVRGIPRTRNDTEGPDAAARVA